MSATTRSRAIGALGVALLLSACSAPRAGAAGERERVNAVLDQFHQAASKCDLAGYFRHFSPSGVFLGTDASERWSRAEFEAFCAPYFARGQGWTYTPLERHVRFADDARTAWFDERLSNAKYGEVRGSGVLVERAGEWWIEHYVMSFTIPNELAGRWLEVRAQGAATSP